MMNERIFELAQQASLYAVSDNSSMLFDVWKKRYTEKLAELIVRECAYVSEAYFGFKDHTPGTAIAKEMKEHFGVEE